jgi:hypothetical protein
MLLLEGFAPQMVKIREPMRQASEPVAPLESLAALRGSQAAVSKSLAALRGSQAAVSKSPVLLEVLADQPVLVMMDKLAAGEYSTLAAAGTLVLAGE